MIDKPSGRSRSDPTSCEKTASDDVTRALAELKWHLAVYAAPDTIRAAILTARSPSFE